MGRSKLKTALKAEKGVDVKKLREKRRIKELSKAKTKRTGGAPKKTRKDDSDDKEDEDEEDIEDGALVITQADEDDAEDSDEEEGENAIDLAALDESSDDSSVDFEEKIVRPKKAQQTRTKDAPPIPHPVKKTAAPADEDEDEDEDDEDEDDEADEEIDWADLEEDEREDLVPRTRININNTAGLLNALKRFAIPVDADSAFFTAHQSLVSTEAAETVIGEDLQDDIKRELAFYAQALDAAKRGRSLLKAAGVPFSRPTDYFAEMVKDDGHMEKVKAKLVEEASSKKASAEARKLRDLKKFGKQVQVAKLQERSKEKRETLDKIKNLKRKRSETGGGDLGEREADLFDVGVDNELKSYNAGNKGGRGGERGGRQVGKRQKKDEKFGFGGKKKYSKSGDATSSGDLSGFNARSMKGGPKGKLPKTSRLGKSRRKAGAGKR
ncbi:eukaryotic rRNA processing protein EBP2-domain-containing protein [Astrocystis sublimbata]|nr:eukaryotic rRNA processing protein EBP2-domain-containing protein [Astrocystis sublimbata]